MARKEKNIHYIYKTTCNVTGKWYVGMHSTSNENDAYMGSGLRLRRSIRKYGVYKHTKEILEYCESRETLVLREIEIITSEFIQDEMCMNLKCGGQGGFVSEEHQLKAAKGRGAYLANRYKTDNDFRAKIDVNLNKGRMILQSLTNLNHNTFEGKKHSEESKQLMSEKAKERIGEKNSQFGTCWIRKDGACKKIKKEDLDSFITDGWIKGRK